MSGRSWARYDFRSGGCGRPGPVGWAWIHFEGNKSMNKSELAGRLADRMALSRSAAAGAVDAVCETIREALAQGEEVRVAGFGTFTTRSRPAQSGRNPRKGESVSISASKAPVFKAGKTLRNAVKGRRESGSG